MTDLSSVAVIIVNYGTPDLAITAVESVLARGHGGRSVEVHLVDNASPGDDAARLTEVHAERDWKDRVTLWLETTNHGFGRGNNLVLKSLAARKAPPTYAFLLNPDARIENEAIATLASFLDDAPRVAAVGAGISHADGRPAVAAFRFPGILSEIEKSVNFGPVSWLLRSYCAALPPDWRAGPVDWVSGAAVMFRLSALREVGFFDPVFFLYFEEVDLMRRLADSGWEVQYRPEARVSHAEGSSTQIVVQKRRPAYLYRSWRRYFSKQGHGYALIVALSLNVASAVGLAIARTLNRPAQVPEHFFRDHMHFVLAPLLGVSRDIEYDADMIRTVPGHGRSNTNPEGIGFFALIAEDYRTHGRQFFSQGFWALFWHRFGNMRMSVRSRLLRAPMTLLYRTMYKLTQWTCGIDLPYTVIVGRRVHLEHFGGMVLIAKQIGDDVIIRQNTTFGVARAGLDKRPVIENGVEIGAGAVVIGDVVVGGGACVGANAVVTSDVPPGEVVVGVPACPVRRIAEDKKHA
jgi:GT2 family glycosyltransferase/serine acetyltransferase